MPTNEQRRATAKRKLERQLERREKQARQRRVLTIAAAVAAVVLVVGAATTVVLVKHRGSAAEATATEASDAPAAAAGQLPVFTASPQLGGKCEYPASAQPASKPVERPRAGKVPTDPAEISVSMMTDQGPVGLMLANNESPCTVNSFLSLAAKDFFKDTGCHRLTTAPMLSVLQCGDPSGDGTGGPGYQFANEYPTDQYQPGDPALQEPVTYPRGTLAMANSGPDTNGSQFFLVYKDSQLPPQYTVFGRIQDDGLATLDKVAAAGVDGGGEDGPPATKVTIKSIRMD
ncbi:MAG TPA: peptidylprolyl isomerase [Mycobacterium sp.]|nr:peptidylprolyl isomerase [Mycobacterium sp.]